MAKIKSFSSLRKADALHEISETKEPLYITRNGETYLVILSPELYEEITEERDHYKRAFEKEREMSALVSQIERSRQAIAKGQRYSEEEFDKRMNEILT